MLVVRKGLVGLGAFASEAVPADATVVDWTGHPLFSEPPRIPRDWCFKEVSPGVYVGPIGPDRFPDAYINHSCEPNSAIRRGAGQVLLVALREIRAGEEITFDYATLYKRPWSMVCGCRARTCRGTIRGSDDSRTGPPRRESVPPASPPSA